MSITRRSLNLDFVRDGKGSGLLDPLFTFTRASTATRINSSGLLETVAVNTPRFDFDQVTLECKGLLIEEGRTNLCLQSRNLTVSPWVSYGLIDTLSQTATGRDGVANSATTIAFNNSIQSGRYQNISLSTSVGDKLTLSAWVKGTGTVQLYIDTVGGTLEGWVSSAVALTSAWQRIAVSGTVANTGHTSVNVQVFANAGSGTSDLKVDCFQLELGSFATSYIPTTSAAVTRAGESCSITTLAPWFNPSSGTILFDGSFFSQPTDYPRAYDFSDPTNNYSIRLFANGSWAYSDITNGSNQALFQSSMTANVRIKNATRYAANSFGNSHNGSAVSTDASGSIPTVPALYFGRDGAGTINSVLIRRFTYLPFAVDDLTLKQMTV